MRVTKPTVPVEKQRRFWQAIRAGLGVEEAAGVACASTGWAAGVFCCLLICLGSPGSSGG